MFFWPPAQQYSHSMSLEEECLGGEKLHLLEPKVLKLQAVKYSPGTSHEFFLLVQSSLFVNSNSR